MAFKKRTRRRTRSAAAPRRRRRAASVGSTTNIIGRKRRSTRRRSSVGSTRSKTARRRHKPGFLGATGMQSKAIQIAEMAVGVGIGAMFVHMALRPLEAKVSEKYPLATKFMGAAEIAIGGGIALWSKSNFIKSIGIGVLAGGVHVVMKQLPIGMHSPAEKGATDMHVVAIPIDANLKQQVAGLINDSRRGVMTPNVGASIVRNGGMNTNTPWVSGSSLLNSTPTVSMGDHDDDYDNVFMPKGISIPMIVAA